MSESNCMYCDNCFHSDLFDGEMKCEITRKWFDHSDIPFDGNQEEECESFKDE